MAEKSRKKRIFIISLLAFICLALVAVIVLAKYSNVLIKGEIEKALGRNFSIGHIELKWGSVEATGIVMKNDKGKEVIKVDSLVVSANFMSLLRKKYIVSSVFVKKPYMYVEVDRHGKLVSPVFPVDEKNAGGAVQDDKDKGNKDRSDVSNPVVIRKIVVLRGAVDYLDGKSPKVPVMTKVRDISLEMKDITIPFGDNFTRFILAAVIPTGKNAADVRSEGKIRFKDKEIECKGSVKGLDITHFKPYYQKSESVNITKGLLDIDLKAKVVSKKINAPGKAVLRGLAFESGPGFGNKFMGVPLSLVVAFMKKSGDQIPVNFVIDGDLDNPNFNISDNFMNKMSAGLADKLGFSLTGVGGAVIGTGAEGTKKVGESVKGVGEKLKSIFK